MLSKRIIAVTFVTVFTIFNPAIADEFSPPPPGVVVPESGESAAGTVPVDNGMEPDPLPLAPPITVTPPVSPPEPTQPVTPPVKIAPPPPSSIKPQNNPMMEKCKIKDKDGNGLIKAYMADSGPNLEGDADAWIWVPRGQCKKLNQGDYSGVNGEISAKINPSNIQDAKTLE